MTDAQWLCPECGNAALSMGQGIQLPPDRWSDEIALQPISCTNCAFLGVAVYEESRRGALDSESWKYLGYRVTESANAILRSAIAQCPEPEDWRCVCPAHLLLGSRDTEGQWNWLQQSGIDRATQFPIRKPQ
jgi:hypothetical protein